MKTKSLRIEIRTEEQDIEDTAHLMEKVARGEPVAPKDLLVFRSIEDMRSFLTPERLRLLGIIRHEEPGSVYELAALAGRDRKAVTTDLEVLRRLGLVRLRKSRGPGRARSIPTVHYERIEISIAV